jgi:hypothetical protein
MDRDTIIRLAREAGFSQPWTAPKEIQERLERFAALVAASEREACAQTVENYALGYAEPVWAFKLTAAIRARGQE